MTSQIETSVLRFDRDKMVYRALLPDGRMLVVEDYAYDEAVEGAVARARDEGWTPDQETLDHLDFGFPDAWRDDAAHEALRARIEAEYADPARWEEGMEGVEIR
jgi:hypothetical protein